MDPKGKKQKLSTSEITSPSLDLKKKKKKKQKVSKSLITTSPFHSEKDLVIPSPSLISKINVGITMKKQNDITMFLAEKVISAVATNSNFVFSSTSINFVLAMNHETEYLSFVTASATRHPLNRFVEIRQQTLTTASSSIYFLPRVLLLHLFESLYHGGPKISAVHGVWTEQSLHVDPSLKDLFENFFKATILETQAEEVREEVNCWASKHTNGLIKDILPPGSVTRDTDSIYGNALYFKVTWEQKFPKSLTRDKEFHLLSGTSVSVPFMRNNTKQYIEEYNGFKVLKLPFRQGGDISLQFSMYFYLPDATDGLNSLVKKMASSTCGFLDSHTPRKEVDVGQFRIPKFKIDFGFEASSALDGLDLASVLLYHKALVDIDEDGAEAAAVTVVTFTSGGRGFNRGRRIDFVADHPFIFMIREDKTGTVLFG
ncbi:hypothetical protein Bca101_065383 [Brassica carinata]